MSVSQCRVSFAVPGRLPSLKGYIPLTTPRKSPDTLLKRVSGSVKRKHYACLIRADYPEWMREECARLNCSQGVLLELLIEAQIRHQIVKQGDVFLYDSEQRRLDVDDYQEWGKSK